MKRITAAFLCLFLILPAAAGCAYQKDDDFDLSTLDFVNVYWERSTDSCTETIYFKDDGSCGYYCACGNPVNDDDLCEGYSYDPKKATIHLDFPYSVSGTVKKIVVKSCDEETLVLDFDGDVRTFERVSEDDDINFSEEIEYNGETYTHLDFPTGCFLYDLHEDLEDYEEDEYRPLPHDKWGLVYYNGAIFVLSAQEDEAEAYYGDRSNYHFEVNLYDPDDDPCGPFPLNVSEEESDFIYNPDIGSCEETLAFDDIESFATLSAVSSDGFIEGTISLAYYNGVWYRRSDIIDTSAEGWPEYIFPLPDAVSEQISSFLH